MLAAQGHDPSVEDQRGSASDQRDLFEATRTPANPRSRRRVAASYVSFLKPVCKLASSVKIGAPQGFQVADGGALTDRFDRKSRIRGVGTYHGHAWRAKQPRQRLARFGGRVGRVEQRRVGHDAYELPGRAYVAIRVPFPRHSSRPATLDS